MPRYPLEAPARGLSSKRFAADPEQTSTAPQGNENLLNAHVKNGVSPPPLNTSVPALQSPSDESVHDNTGIVLGICTAILFVLVMGTINLMLCRRHSLRAARAVAEQAPFTSAPYRSQHFGSQDMDVSGKSMIYDIVSMIIQRTGWERWREVGGEDVSTVASGDIVDKALPFEPAARSTIDVHEGDQEPDPARGVVSTHSAPSSQDVCETKSQFVVCNICFENTPTIVMLPCGHGGICSECLEMLPKPVTGPILCPFCREPVQKVAMVDLSTCVGGRSSCNACEVPTSISRGRRKHSSYLRAAIRRLDMAVATTAVPAEPSVPHAESPA